MYARVLWLQLLLDIHQLRGASTRRLPACLLHTVRQVKLCHRTIWMTHFWMHFVSTCIFPPYRVIISISFGSSASCRSFSRSYLTAWCSVCRWSTNYYICHWPNMPASVVKSSIRMLCKTPQCNAYPKITSFYTHRLFFDLAVFSCIPILNLRTLLRTGAPP